MIWPQPRRDAEGSRDRRRRPRARAIPGARRRRRREHGRGRRHHRLRRARRHEADALILSGPGFRGWGALPWFYSASLWVSSHVRPDWIVVPPEGVRIVATDNNRKLREMWFDPLVQKSNRIDSVFGVVSIMEEADQKIASLPDSVPTLMLYGAKDEMIPAEGVQRATAKMPPHVRTAYYVNGLPHADERPSGREGLERYPGLCPRPGITPAVGRAAAALAGPKVRQIVEIRTDPGCPKINQSRLVCCALVKCISRVAARMLAQVTAIVGAFLIFECVAHQLVKSQCRRADGVHRQHHRGTTGCQQFGAIVQ